jgi:hypothetical protein
MPDISREEALTHFGVKGMRWGVKKARAAEANRINPGSVPLNKLGGKERRAEVGRRLNVATEMAVQNPKQLFLLQQGAHRTMLSGKEFTDALIRSNGRLYVSDISPVDLEQG